MRQTTSETCSKGKFCQHLFQIENSDAAVLRLSLKITAGFGFTPIVVYRGLDTKWYWDTVFV